MGHNFSWSELATGINNFNLYFSLHFPRLFRSLPIHLLFPHSPHGSPSRAGPLALPEAGRGLVSSTNHNAALALPGSGSPLIGWLVTGPQAPSQGWRGLLVVIMMPTTLSCAPNHPDSQHPLMALHRTAHIPVVPKHLYSLHEEKANVIE